MAVRTSRKTVSKPAIVTKRVPGLHGQGLIRCGKESRLELRDRLSLTRSVFARVVNVSERTIAKVEATGTEVEKLQRPYNEVFRLFEALSEVIESGFLGGWFMAPNDAFGGLKPIEVIERGDVHRLWDMAFRLRSGMPG